MTFTQHLWGGPTQLAWGPGRGASRTGSGLPSGGFCLCQAGANVDAQDKDLRTPLVEAIINNHIEVARYLIQSGACVYHVVGVCTCFPHQGGLCGAEFSLPVPGVKEEDGYTGLHHAAKLGNLEIVNMLLETGQVDVNAQVRTGGAGGAGGRAPLNSPVATRLLQKRGFSSRLLQDSGGWTPIIWAAEHKHLDVIKVLLNRGADVNVADKVCVSLWTQGVTTAYSLCQKNTLLSDYLFSLHGDILCLAEM